MDFDFTTPKGLKITPSNENKETTETRARKGR